MSVRGRAGILDDPVAAYRNHVHLLKQDEFRIGNRVGGGIEFGDGLFESGETTHEVSQDPQFDKNRQTAWQRVAGRSRRKLAIGGARD